MHTLLCLHATEELFEIINKFFVQFDNFPKIVIYYVASSKKKSKNKNFNLLNLSTQKK